jgi:hypothetical protein
MTGEAPDTCSCDQHRLYRIVTKTMIHKCDEKRCFKEDDDEGVCKYGYPFPVTSETFVDDRGRVRYMRRSEADARVVPYNAALCLKYNAHINVDIAHTTM